MSAPFAATKTVIGLNVGAGYASIAIINNEGLADCIANEDGERQIATAIAFNGEEIYIGNQAKPQLIRNHKNTVLGFRNLLGKKFSSDLPQPLLSTPIVDSSSSPAFNLTFSPSEGAEPTAQTLTAHDIAVRVLSSLHRSAVDYLGVPVDGAVIAVPHEWSAAERDALRAAAKDAGIAVLDLIDDWSAAASAYADVLAAEDPNVLIVDMGESSTAVTVVAARQGLFSPLAHIADPTVGGAQLDEQLLAHFAKEFTKKTKVPLPAALAADLPEADRRALTKLLLATESTKRTLSASNSASCAVESLKDGIDFSAQINRLRFNLLGSKVFNKVAERAKEVVKQASLEPEQINKVILVGGSSSLPALRSALEPLFPESTDFLTTIDPDQAIARGSAIQARLLSSPELPELPPAAAALDVVSTSAPIGLRLGDNFITLVEQDTPLPARRIVRFEGGAEKAAKEVALSVWEGKHEVQVEVPAPQEKPAKTAEDEEDEDEDEDEEPEEIRTPVTKPTTHLAELVVPVEKQGPVELTVIVQADGKVELRARQIADGAKEVQHVVPAPKA